MATVLPGVQSGERDLGADGFAAAIAQARHPVDDMPRRRAATKAPPAEAGPDRLSDLADRVRNWYLLAVNHPKWKTYIPQAREDEGYYIGGDLQWSKDGSFDSLNRLRDKKRTTASINHIQSVVDVLIGFERQNRYDLKASPQGDEDEESARILSMLLRFVQDQAEVQEYESEAFGDGLIRGMSALEVKINWQVNEPEGEIEMGVLTPGEDVIWDPYAKRYDLSDARFVEKFRWGYVEDVIAEYPEHEAIITEQVNSLNSLFMPLTSNVSSDGGRGDAYGSVATPNVDRLREEELFYDPRDRRVLLIEAWYTEHTRAWHVVDIMSGRSQEVDSEKEARDLARHDPQALRAVGRRLKKVRTALVLPATHTCLYDEATPYENDDAAYPIVPFIAKSKRNGEIVYGLVRNMKDPQLLENLRISQIVDILKQWGNIRPLVPKGSVEDEKVFEEHWSRAPIVYNAKMGQPGWFTPVGLEQVVRGLIEIAVQFKMNLREITGINTDLLGLKSDDTSGIAIARRQAQGQIIATVFFDNFKRTRKFIGQRLARRIQQVFTAEQVLRLIDDATGEPVEVLLNPAEARELRGEEWLRWVESKMEAERKPHILRSVEALKFDVVLSESPSTPSARATALMALLEIVGKMPSILPAVIDKIVALADVPDKAEIIRRIRSVMEQAGIPSGDVKSLNEIPTAGGAPAAAGIQPAAPPPVAPQGGGVGPSMIPPPRRGGTGVQMRRTLSLAAGGMPPGPGQI